MAVHVPSRLYRSRSQKMIAGVSGGLGEYFDVDPILIRLLFVVTTFISGVGLLAYVVLWIVVPLQGDEDTPRMDALRRDFDDISSRVREQLDPHRPATPADPTVRSTPAGTTVGATTTTVTAAETTSDASPVGFAATEGTETTTTTAPPSPGDPGAGAAALTNEDAVTAKIRPEPHAPTVADELSVPFGEPAYETGTYGPRAYETSAYEAGAVGEPRISTPYVAPISPTERSRRRQHWAGAILIVLGVLFLAQNLGLLWWIQARFVWPLVLVGIGAWLLFGRVRRG